MTGRSPGAGIVAFLWPIPFLVAFLLPAATVPYKSFTSDDYWFAGYGETPGDPSVATVRSAFVGDWHSGHSGRGGWLRPFPRILFYLNDKLFGLDNPWGYHLTNVLLHAVNAGLVALLVGGLLRRRAGGELPEGGTAVACFAGLLFACYPPAPGAVSWISGRTDLLATLFTLAALALAVARVPLALRAAGIFVLGIGAAFSKEPGLFVPLFLAPVLLAAHWPPKREQWRAELLPMGALFGASVSAAVLMLAWRVHFLGGLGGYPDQFGGKHPAALLLWWKDYAMVATGARQAASTLVFCAALAIGGILLLVRARGLPPAAFVLIAGLFHWLLAGVPIMGLPPLPIENGRFFYLAGVGAALTLAGGFGIWRESRGRIRRAGWALAAALLALYAWAFIDNDRRWMQASRISAQVVEELVALADAHPERQLLIVFRNMDFVSYEYDALQQYRGAKVLPWNQARWGLWRASQRRHIPGWGIERERLERPAVLAYIDETDGEYAVLGWSVASPIFREVEPDEYGVYTLPFAGLTEIAGPAEAYYGAAFIDLETSAAGHHPAIRSDGRAIHSQEQAAAGRATSHSFALGLNPHEHGLWEYRPLDEPGSPEVGKIVVALLPLGVLSYGHEDSGEPVN